MRLMLEQSLALTFTVTCSVCKSEQCPEDAENIHNSHLGVDPETAIKDGLCPSCYGQLPKKLTASFSNRLAKWIFEEMKKPVPSWRKPRRDQRRIELFQSIKEDLYWASPALSKKYDAAGGFRGLMDSLSGEFERTTVEEKRKLIEELKKVGIRPDDLFNAGVRYLEAVCATPFRLAYHEMALGWRDVMGNDEKLSNIKERLM